MKTTDAAVLDEPKIHEPTADAVVEPAIEGRPRPTAVGIKEAKIYIEGNFTPKPTRKSPFSTMVSCTATEFSRGFVFIMVVFSDSANILIVCGIRLARSAWEFL